MEKRQFIKRLSLLGMSGFIGSASFGQLMKEYQSVPDTVLAGDEDFWEKVRQGYRIKTDYINLENGYYCFLPQETLEKYIEHIREVNLQGSYYMRTVQWDNKKKMASQLAAIAGCMDDELIITRNTTESLDTVIGGFHWKEGDEAVMADQDYGAMLDMFTLMQRRYGIVNKRISIPNHPGSDQEIVDLYAAAITPRTKLLMVCHMVNITGQILPIRKICDMAHAKGVKVMVDGAHAFAHLQFSVKDLDCDYYGASLHKWLSVPLGAGLLYIKKERIPDIWPLMADSDSRKPDDIYRLNHIGTHPVATDLTILDAIDFYTKIGPARKEARLRFLQQYWTSKVRDLPNIVVNTPKEAGRACAIANVGVKTIKPAALAEILLKKYRIYTVAIDYANVQGCRITPNIYTTTRELDQLVLALKELNG